MKSIEDSLYQYFKGDSIFSDEAKDNFEGVRSIAREIEQELAEIKSRILLFKNNQAVLDKYVYEVYKDLSTKIVNNEAWILFSNFVIRRFSVDADWTNICICEIISKDRRRFQYLDFEIDKEKVMLTGWYTYARLMDQYPEQKILPEIGSGNIFIIKEKDYTSITLRYSVLHDLPILINPTVEHKIKEETVDDLFRDNVTFDVVLAKLRNSQYIDEENSWMGISGNKVEPIALFHTLREFHIIRNIKKNTTRDCKLLLDFLKVDLNSISEDYYRKDYPGPDREEFNIMFRDLAR